ncbi:hypothetical protein NUSPORA_01240 [Nucleospora cyclopteri]
MGNRVSHLTNEDKELRKFNHFPSNDVREWAIHFRSRYPSNGMKARDIEEIFYSYFPEQKKDNQHIKKFSKQLFNTLNIGESGCVDFNEVLIAFSILAKGSPFEKVRWIFRFYDTDKDGVVSKEELEESLSNIYKIAYPNDTNSIIKDIIEKIFRKAEPGSEYLTFSDFEKLCYENDEDFKKISNFCV